MGHFIIIEVLIYIILAVSFGLTMLFSKKMRMYFKMHAYR